MTTHESSHLKGGPTFFPSHVSSGLQGGKLGSCHKEKSSLEIKTSLVSAVPQFAVVADPFVTLTQVTGPESHRHHHSPTCSATGHLGVPRVFRSPCIFTAIHCPCFRHHRSLPSLFHTCLLCSVPAGPMCLFSTKNWFKPFVGTCFLSRYMPSLCSSYHTSQVSGRSCSSPWPLPHTGSSR